MTNPSPEPNHRPPSLLTRLISPRTLLLLGGTVVGLGAGIYLGARYFVYNHLPGVLASQLSQRLGRQVQIGPVEHFRLNRLRLGPASIPPTRQDPDYLNFKALDLKFNPLPLLIGRPLILDILVVDPNLYLAQDKNGQWVNLDVGKGRETPRLPLDIKVQVEDGDISLHPLAASRALTISTTGTGRYLKTKQQELQYDLQGAILDNKFQARGVSILPTGTNQIDLSIQELNLGQILSLFPNLPVQLKRGTLGADLSLNLPSFAQIDQTQGQGNLVLKDWLAQTQIFKDPLRLSTNLTLEGQTVNLQQGKVGLGKTQAYLGGKINWATGYDLKINFTSFNLPEFLSNISIKSPLNLQANFQSQIKLTGKLDQPVFTGKIVNTQPVILDRVIFRSAQTEFQTNLDLLTVKNFRAAPSAGGELSGGGTLKLGVLQALKEGRAIDLQKMLLKGNFQALLPTEKVLSPYVSFPQDVQVGNLQANLKLQGSWAKPAGILKWSAPNNTIAAQVGVSGSGSVKLVDDNLFFNDNRLVVGTGTLLVEGSANLSKEKWQTQISSQNFPLTPFVSLICTRQSQTCSYLEVNQPLTLTTLQANLNGDSFQTVSQGQARLRVNTKNGNISLNSRVRQGDFTALATAAEFPLNPFVNVPVALDLSTAQLNLVGSVSALLKGDLNPLQGEGSLRVLVDGQPLSIRGNLEQGEIQAIARTSRLNLSPFLPNLTVPVSLGSTQVRLRGKVAQIRGANLATLLNSLTAQAEARVLVDRNLVLTEANLSQGSLQAIAKSSFLNLNKLLPQLNFPLQARQTQVNLTAKTTTLLNLIEQKAPSFPDLQILARSQLAIAQGRVNWQANLINNQWKSQANVTNLNPDLFLAKKLNLAPVSGKVQLGGNISNLRSASSSLPVQLQTLALTSGSEKIQAQGNLLVSQPLQNLDISTLNLKVNAQGNLARLPWQSALSLVPVDRVFLPNLEIVGVGNFSGQVRGNNLLSQFGQKGSLQVDGNIQLQNFAFNQRVFEPLLSGRLRAGLGEKIALDLYGQVDVIAATVEPCQRQDCLLPYLPLSLEIKQTSQTTAPLLITGIRSGDQFQANIEQFPLEVLQIAPGQNYNFPGFISGTLKAAASVDLFTLAGNGQINITHPGLGTVKADQFKANVNYENQIARLETAVLKFGKSAYAARGFLNFKTSEILAQVDVEEAYVEDILRTFQIATIDRLLTVLQLRDPQYATAKEVQPRPIEVGDANADLAQQVNLLAIIDQEIRKIANKRDSGTIPTELDVRGRYSAQVALTGTLKNPRLQTQFTGENWQWFAQQPFPDIVNPLGLVMREEQFIPIELITFNASFQDGNIAIQPARLKIRDALAQFQGNLSLEENQAQFSLSNLSIDEIRNYVDIPLDLSGHINASGTLSGSVVSPRIQGEFSFLDGAVNANTLAQDIRGFFDYNDARLQVNSEPSPVWSFSASIPFPPLPNSNDRFHVKGQFKTPALALLPAFTQGQVNWLGGEGEVNFAATGRLDNSQDWKLKDLVAEGMINLANASLQTSTFPEVLTVNGQIRLTPEYLQVDHLEGNLERSEVAIQGTLPFFQPLNPQLTKPLTISLSNSQIEFEDLYKGGVTGEVIIKGTALNPQIPPLITGQVLLANGQIFIPKSNPEVAVKTKLGQTLTSQWLGRIERQNNQIQPKLKDFQVSLRSLKISQSPIYEFGFGGDIILNGSLNDWENLQTQGAIRLDQGRFGFLNTRFVLNRRHNNLISFNPNQGLLNPDLDIQMRSIITDEPNAGRNLLGLQRGELSNEIPDNSLNRVQRIDVTLALVGELQELLPNLRQGEGDVCRYRPSESPIPTEAEILANQERVMTCLQRIASAARVSDNDLITNSSAVKLTSSPPRNEGEIVRLLGEQIFIFAESFQGKNSAELLQEGVIALAVPLLLQGYIYDVENAIADSIKAADFNILPNLQAVYRVSDEGFVRFSYDYNFNEVTVRYETRF